QTIRKLQDELDNTTQLIESIRSKGADLTQFTNFLDGTLSHIRSTETSTTASTPSTPSISNCSECRQLKNALMLELTGKERYRFGYEQLAAMVKEAAPILRKQKQDYEASFEVIAKLTSELNEARKELSDLHQLSDESIENYRYIQRENQYMNDDNKSLGTKIQVLLAEIEEHRTGKRPAEINPTISEDENSSQQVPLTFRNVVELQHANQKLDKMVRELRAQNVIEDEDLNRTRFEELKKEHKLQEVKLKEAKTQLEMWETQMNSLVQERDFLRLLVSRSSSQTNSSSSSSVSTNYHQLENLRDQITRLQEKIDELSKKNTQIYNEKDELTRSSNEKIRTLQYELLTSRTEVEQTITKLNLAIDEQSTNRLTITSLRTEIKGWQERHKTILEMKEKQESQYYEILNELRQIKEEKSTLEMKLNTVEIERKFERIKYEQTDNECKFLKNEIKKNEQIQPVIEKLQNLAEFTKEKTKAMFEARMNDLMLNNDDLKQRFENEERERENDARNFQIRLDEVVHSLQQEKLQHQEMRNKFNMEKERAEQINQQLKEFETKLTTNKTQKSDFEQQLGDYEKELKLFKVQLESANHELELKQTLIQSGNDNINELNSIVEKSSVELENMKQEFDQKRYEFESEIQRLKGELAQQEIIQQQHETHIQSLNSQIQTIQDQHHAEFTKINELIEQAQIEKLALKQQLDEMENIRSHIKFENEQLQQNISQ
ncbi:unnamed protein product, partial [Didymodactylos carnosus]